MHVSSHDRGHWPPQRVVKAILKTGKQRNPGQNRTTQLTYGEYDAIFFMPQCGSSVLGLNALSDGGVEPEPSPTKGQRQGVFYGRKFAQILATSAKRKYWIGLQYSVWLWRYWPPCQ